MHQSIKLVIDASFWLQFLNSCNHGESLQSYYVANQETPNFISQDIPTSFVEIDRVEFNQRTIRSLQFYRQDLNMLGYKTSMMKKLITAELAKVTNHFKK